MRRVLRVQPGLHRVPGEHHLRLGEGQRLARRHPQLLLDEVEPGHQLGHRVLDLQAGVHLQEEALARPVGRHDELHGADPGVADAPRGLAGVPADPLARLAGRAGADGASSMTFWCRRCSEHSRSPRWTTLAVRVGEHLHLDVARRRHVALDEEGVVAERPRGLAASGGDGAAERPPGGVTTCMPLPPPPAEGLMSSGIPDRRDRGERGRRRSGRARRDPARRARLERRRPPWRGSCRPSPRSPRGDGPTKTIPAAAQAASERGVLGQEAVARVDRLQRRSRRAASMIAVDVQVAVGSGRTAEVGLVGSRAGPRRPRRCRPRPSGCRAGAGCG